MEFIRRILRKSGLARIDAEIREILQRELNDAEEKEADPIWNEGYGSIGSDVRSGVYKAENAIKFAANGRALRKRDIPRIRAALERAVTQYRSENEDPAGYGVGTLYNIIRAVDRLETK